MYVAGTVPIAVIIHAVIIIIVVIIIAVVMIANIFSAINAASKRAAVYHVKWLRVTKLL